MHVLLKTLSLTITATLISLSAISVKDTSANTQPVIENFYDKKVRCYCNSRKEGKYSVERQKLKNTYKEDNLFPLIQDESNTVYLIELPIKFAKDYVEKCKITELQGRPKCWLKKNSVKASQQPEIMVGLPSGLHPCKGLGSVMGSERCDKTK